ncbi:hypothetical protein [Methylobacterium sp. 17Sr1-1]|uniref:hypothetical protein n=1 Tax=Methylobacterium sp. 17Sr1-1 TaxID=2202826 RepID=UPI0013A549D5|nr:hypothetical protein [Methylobacterium sp. 17Sr1-1]
MSEFARSRDDLAQGTWYIVRSTLGLWRNQAGAISYCMLPDGSVGDFVTVQKTNGSNHIIGVDRPIDQEGWQWQWRGVQPLTILLRSRWCFVAGDAEAGWAVTLFDKTIFTAAGIDVYCRTPTIGARALAAATSACAADVRTRDQAGSLFEPPPWRA